MFLLCGTYQKLSKPYKPFKRVLSYKHSMSLLSATSDLFWKLRLLRFRPLIVCKNWYQIVSLTERQVCSSLFLKVWQSFERVQCEGCIYKCYQNYADLWASYISNLLFIVKWSEKYTEMVMHVCLKKMLVRIQYIFYTNNLPEINDATIAHFQQLWGFSYSRSDD